MNEFVLDDLLAMPEPAASAQSVAVAGNEFLLDDLLASGVGEGPTAPIDVRPIVRRGTPTREFEDRRPQPPGEETQPMTQYPPLVWENRPVPPSFTYGKINFRPSQPAGPLRSMDPRNVIKPGDSPEVVRAKALRSGRTTIGPVDPEWDSFGTKAWAHGANLGRGFVSGTGQIVEGGGNWLAELDDFLRIVMGLETDEALQHALARHWNENVARLRALTMYDE